MNNPPISVTEAAAEQIRKVIEEHGWDGYGLRFGLKDGGCSGYVYDIDFEAAPADGDLVVEAHGVRVFVPALQVPMLEGTVVGYKKDAFQEGFDIQNPQAKRHCGCGESFDV